MYFRVLKGIIKHKFLRKRVPLRVTHEVTMRCNLRCTYCEHEKHFEELSTDEIKYMMNEFKENGCVSWGFTGGEPLLRKDIGKLINYSKKLGFFTNLQSNGILIPAKINEIKNLDLLGISIDGPEKINDKYKGRGHFKEAIRGIKVAKSRKIKVFVTVVITDDSLKYLLDMVEFAKKLGIQIDFQPKYIFKKGQLIYNDFKDKDLFLKNIEQLIELRKKTNIIMSSLPYLESLKRYPNALLDIGCLAGKYYCYITSSGIINPCFFKRIGYKYKKGKLTEILKKLPSMNKCSGCFLNCYTEYNLLFSLNFRACLNAMEVVKN